MKEDFLSTVFIDASKFITSYRMQARAIILPFYLFFSHSLGLNTALTLAILISFVMNAREKKRGRNRLLVEKFSG